MGAMEIVSFDPRGFCSGVLKAFSLAKKAREEHKGSPIYLVGSLVHNERAMRPLYDDGFVLLNEKDGPLCKQMEEIPNGSIVLYSAHGHDKESYDEIAKRKGFIVYDASCEHIVSNLEKMKKANGSIAFVVDRRHLEAKAASSLKNVTIIDPKDPSFGYFDYAISQTSLDEETFFSIENGLREINPHLVSLDGRCPSTKYRQMNAIKAPNDIDLFIIIGSKDSSNTKRLAHLVKKYHENSDVIQVLDCDELKKYDLSKYEKTALLSGASSPKAAYEEIKEYLKSL